MRTIGLLGGMSWESTAEYYRIINQTVRDRMGPLRSAPVLLLSLDFGPVEQTQREGRWAEAGAILGDAARRLQAGGAECLVLCTNTMHRVADDIQAACPLPFLHIADAVGTDAARRGHRTLGLLGTRHTMNQSFWKDRLFRDYGLTAIVPGSATQDQLHDIIYGELCVGLVREASRAVYQQAIADLAAQGAEAVILGCTEISLLVRPTDTPVPLLDTTVLHAKWAAEFSMARSGKLSAPEERS